jgi:hypothetical protein
MSDAPKSAQTADQAEDNTGRSPYEDYLHAGNDVLRTILERDQTHGNPEAFGATFAPMLQAYLRAVVAAGRPIGPADAFVVLDLMKTARIAVGGHHPDHYRDKAGYGLLGLVHVARAFAAVQAQQAAQEARQEAEARMPRAPEPEPEEARETFAAVQVDDHDDADLLRWALDPSTDPFADQIEAGGQLRPGVTPQAVEARRRLIMKLLQDFQPASSADQERRSVALAKYGRPAPVAA